MTISTTGGKHVRNRHGAAGTVAIAIIAGATVLGLLVAASTFGALAVAFPLAVPFAEALQVSVSAHDLLIAQQFADLSWVFGTFTVAILVVAGVVVVKTVSYISPRTEA